jgi:hypothetical protein
MVYICVHILMQLLTVYFPLQITNKPHDGVANCVFILELAMVTKVNIQLSQRQFLEVLQKYCMFAPVRLLF